MDAGENLHQSALAGTILSDNRKHLAGQQTQTHATERPHARKTFADALHLQSGRGFG
jgi:hypothetical protein